MLLSQSIAWFGASQRGDSATQPVDRAAVQESITKLWQVLLGFCLAGKSSSQGSCRMMVRHLRALGEFCFWLVLVMSNFEV